MKRIIPTGSRQRPAPGAVARAGDASKTGVYTLPVTGFSRVKFTVSIRRGPGMFPRPPAVFPGETGHSEHAGQSVKDAGSTIINPVIFAYEESLQTSGCPTAAAHSRFDTPDGKSPRRAAVSRRIAQAVADDAGMAHGGGGSGAEAGARRLLNGKAGSVRPVPRHFRERSDGDQS